ncbi:MAG: zincin-like metallopeptidase domain-containing protein [Planctomycetota bacterium]
MTFDSYQYATDTIIAALECGTVPWRHPLLGGGQDQLPKNLNTGKTYRGINLFLLALAGWDAGYANPWWLTFKQARDRGGHVRKGEKSTSVIFWKEMLVEDEKTGKPKKVPVIKNYRVFSVEQCDNIDYPKPGTLERDFEPLEAAEQIVAGYEGAPFIETTCASVATYTPTTDLVQMPKPERFVDQNAYYATLFHELGHSTGHRSRLDREQAGVSFGSAKYAKEELIAEFAAAGLCAMSGIPPSEIENSAAYIANWLNVLRSDKRLVVHAAGAGQKAMDWIVGQRQR